MLVVCAAFISLASFAQETYKCKINGTFVYQDRPCPGAVRYSNDLPATAPKATKDARYQPDMDFSSTSQVDVQRAKTEKDKAYIDERVKARIFDREKSESLARINSCDAEAADFLNRANAVSHGYQQGTPISMRDAANLQLDAQRRQNEILSLQGQASARRNQCDNMRREHDQRFTSRN